MAARINYTYMTKAFYPGQIHLTLIKRPNKNEQRLDPFMKGII